LREKVRTAQIDGNQPVKTFGGGVENIGANLGRHAGVVHQHIEPAKTLPDKFEQTTVVVQICHIGPAIRSFRAARAELGHDIAQLVRFAPSIDHDIEAGSAQCMRDPEADSPSSAGNDRDLSWSVRR
jgi:hypothetical protein